MTATQAPMINVQVEGEWKQFPKGTRLIEACMRSGHFVPHYCYHPKLSSPGNCRMCLVELGMPKMTPERKLILGADGRPEIAWSPRPAISCATEISEGMAVRTSSPLVEECRKGVMEFLLINHPLDCPICDQAGECRLQEFSVQYGKGESRFLEEKVKKPKRVDIGSRIVLDDERCILCSRCVRFMQEIAKDDVLGFVNRGSHTTLTIYPGKRLDNNYSLNTVDICPVGALTSKDFRFSMRVWFLRETKSIDVSCGTGVNILIGSRENIIHRITPRENDFVNSCWMPDSHRLNFRYVNSAERLRDPRIKEDDLPATWPKALQAAAEQLQADSKATAMIASARMTNEELFLARRLANALGIELFDVLPRPQKGDGFLISPDGNPNTSGAMLIGVATGKLPEIVSGVASGTIKALLVLGEDVLECGISESDLANLDSLVATAILPSRTTANATVLLPAASWAEKRGSMINVKGRLQRLNQAISSPGSARSDWEILRDLIQAAGGSNGIHTIDELFKRIAAEYPALEGLSLSRIGDLGIDLSERLITANQAIADSAATSASHSYSP
ncbi:MAG TPA: molybdopterin-dependent oxidoreductase [Terrimicrobiaceae bacterium]|nr:molybdopterin-dependent oxidoreductase [Terrimicrobiaceae bacterium]